MIYPYIFYIYTLHAWCEWYFNSSSLSVSLSLTRLHLYIIWKLESPAGSLCIYYVHTLHTCILLYNIIMCYYNDIRAYSVIPFVQFCISIYVCDKNIFMYNIIIRNKRYLLICSGDTVSLEAIAQQRKIGILKS